MVCTKTYRISLPQFFCSMSEPIHLFLTEIMKLFTFIFCQTWVFLVVLSMKKHRRTVFHNRKNIQKNEMKAFLWCFSPSVECNYFNMFHFDEHEQHKKLMHIKIVWKSIRRQKVCIFMRICICLRFFFFHLQNQTQFTISRSITRAVLF